jgi:hypothetical protein
VNQGDVRFRKGLSDYASSVTINTKGLIPLNLGFVNGSVACSINHGGRIKFTYGTCNH